MSTLLCLQLVQVYQLQQLQVKGLLEQGSGLGLPLTGMQKRMVERGENHNQGANLRPIGLSPSGVPVLGIHCRYSTFPKGRRADGRS